MKEVKDALTKKFDIKDMGDRVHLATKIWGGSVINEWAYLERQVPWNTFLGEFLYFLQIVWGNF